MAKPAPLHVKLPAIVHEAEGGGYWAEVPALPGCFTQAEPLAELRRNLQDAVDLDLEDRAPSPPPARKASGPP